MNEVELPLFTKFYQKLKIRNSSSFLIVLRISEVFLSRHHPGPLYDNIAFCLSHKTVKNVSTCTTTTVTTTNAAFIYCGRTSCFYFVLMVSTFVQQMKRFKKSLYLEKCVWMWKENVSIKSKWKKILKTWLFTWKKPPEKKLSIK